MIWSDVSRVMSRDVPKTNLFVQKPKVDFPVVCWIFDYWIFQNDPSPQGANGRTTLVKYFLGL